MEVHRMVHHGQVVEGDPGYFPTFDLDLIGF